MTMSIDRRVQGVIRTKTGDPVPGVMVELVSMHENRFERSALLDISDEDGQYVIDSIPPGNYHLGINIDRTPTREQPYEPIYHSNTPDGKALMIAFGTQPEVKSYDLMLPRRLLLIKMQGKIVDASGSPPRQRINIRIKGPGLFQQIEQETIVVDESGRFEFELCEGIRYSAFAFAGRFFMKCTARHSNSLRVEKTQNWHSS